MNYQPGPVPLNDKDLKEYLGREFRRISESLRDNAPTVFYRNSIETEVSLSAGDSANYKAGLTSNVIRISASVTVTLTGIADTTPFRERAIINTGVGVVVLKSQGTESSASHRFALPSDWQLSENCTAVIWFDPISSRHRGLSRT